MNGAHVRRAALVGLLALALAVMSTQASAQGAKPVSGGGASFPQLELEQWRADVSKPPYLLKVDYQAAGSTFGRQQYIAGQLDYGVSDIPFQEEEIPALNSSPRRDFVYVPVSAGGLGFMYNLRGPDNSRITNLRLSPRTVCRAFTEQDIHWNDPEIQADNPGVVLPADQIRPVARADGSGTSYVFSQFCIATAPDVWAAFIALIQAVAPDGASLDFRAGRATSAWPAGYGKVGTAFASDGVANVVANDVTGRNTITYNEAGFAKVRGFPNAWVRNSAGVYVQPEAANVTVALGYATGRPDGTFALDYLTKDPGAYFPSSYSYVIAQTTGFDPGKGVTLATFLQYSVTAGQRRAVELGYARLSTVLVVLALNQISRIPGAPPTPTDLGGAPPPPPNAKAVPPLASGNRAAAGSGAKGGTKGAGSGAGATGTGAGTTDPAAVAAAVAAAAAATTVPEVQLDQSQIDEAAAAAPASASAAGASDPISDKEALWLFLLGIAIVGIGSGSANALIRRGREGTGP